MVKDIDSKRKLVTELISLSRNKKLRDELSINIKKLSLTDNAEKMGYMFRISKIMNLNQYKNIYFIGIGGIGMSGLARYFNNKNVNILGYDKYRSPLCSHLNLKIFV